MTAFRSGILSARLAAQGEGEKVRGPESRDLRSVQEGVVLLVSQRSGRSDDFLGSS